MTNIGIPEELSFLFHEDVQRIFNNFTALFQIRIGFYSPDGRELKVGQNRDLCAYCRMVRLCKGGSEACNDEDRKARLNAMNRKSLIVYTCHGGMTEAVKPIMQDDNLIGFAMIGQIRMDEIPPVKWTRLWGRRGQQPSLKESYQNQPVCRKADLPRILELFSDLMDLLSSQGKINRKGMSRLSDFLAWVKNHPDQKITLNEAASRNNLSPSRFSHLIKEEYGISFTALLRKLRMEKARFLLSHFPGKSIKEVALAVGFSDPLYFSRQFKIESGISPNQYKKQQNHP